MISWSLKSCFLIHNLYRYAMRARADAKEVPKFMELIRNHRPAAAAALLAGLYTLNSSFDPHLESTSFQRLNLKCENPVSKFACQMQLVYRYVVEALGGEAGIEVMGLTTADVEGKLAQRFQVGVKAAVEATANLKGLFDSLGKGLYETLRMLFADMDDMRKEEAAAKAAAVALGSPGGNLPKERLLAADDSPVKLSPAKALREARRSQSGPIKTDGGGGGVGLYSLHPDDPWIEGA
jgi:hypothetical protein